MSDHVKMPSTLKVPRFETEAQEVEWWEQNRQLVSDEFEKAAAAGTLRRGTVMKLALAADMGLELEPADLLKAQEMAERKGLTFQQYVSLLLHEAVEKDFAA